ncbi:MAG: hypothetical protein ABIJ27_08445 [Candidatus Omnitrophota bacterium]
MRYRAGSLTLRFLTVAIALGALFAARAGICADPERSIQQLEEYKSRIESFKMKMDERLEGGAAKDTMDRMFRERGIERSLSYVESWSDLLYRAYHRADNKGPRGYIQRHIEDLERSIDQIAAGGVVTREDMEYFEEGMQAWEEKSAWIEGYFFRGYLIQATILARALEKKQIVSEQIAEADGGLVSARRKNDKEDLARLELLKSRLDGRFRMVAEEEEAARQKRDAFLERIDMVIREPAFISLEERAKD